MSINLSQAELLPYNGDEGNVPPAIYIKLTPEALQAISESNGDGIKFHFGKKWELKIGEEIFGATNIPEASHVDLFRKSFNEGYQHVGKVSHRVTIRRTMNDTVASTKLRNQHDELLKEKESHRAILIQGVEKNGRSIKRPTSAAGIRRGPTSSTIPASIPNPSLMSNSNEGTRSLPTSPSAFGNSPSPNLPAYSSTSTSSSTATSTTASNSSKSLASMTTSKKPLSSMTLVSGTMRVLHLLALGANSVSTISARTHIPIGEVQGILNDYGKEVSGSQYILADNRYKDLRVWEWKHYSNSERSKVIQDCIEAFDRLGYPNDHIARRNIIDPKLRKSENTVATSTSTATPTATPTTTTTTSTTPPSITITSPPSDEKNSNQSPQNANAATVAKRMVGAILKNNKSKKANGTNSGTNTPRISASSPSPTKNSINKKIKSAEFIKDSDDEATDYEMISNTTTNTTHNTPRSGTPIANVSTPRPSGSPSIKPSTGAVPIKRKAAASGMLTTSESKVRKVARSSTPSTTTSSSSSSSSSKLQQPTSEGDMFELAKKFKDTYSEYAKLYSVLSTRGKRPKSDIQKLLSMHRDLETWKQLLWASSPKMKKTSI